MEEEWRDPENVSSTRPIRGVLPKLRVLCIATTRKPGLHSLGQVMNCCSGDSYSVEFPESATCSTDPWDLSTPPHALRLFVVGRDDRSFYAETALGLAASCPNFTETTLDTPGSCMVTPYITGATDIVFLLCVMMMN